MNHLEVVNEASPSTNTVESLLMEMLRYGKPALHCMDDRTWFCSLVLNTDILGAEVKITSGFRHPLPIDACNVCNDRLVEALKTIDVSRLLK